MTKRLLILLFLCLLWPFSALAAEKITIVYQNDLHAWVSPSSTRMGLGGMARILTPMFKEQPNAFYAMAGDLFTGPDLPEAMKGTAALSIWNRFWEHLSDQGFGQRVLISAGNHEFDYGVPEPGSFWSGLLCANLVDKQDDPYYTPFKIVKTLTGLKVGFMGLILKGNHRVLAAVGRKQLKVISPLKAVKRFVPEMGPLDLTVLMIHDDLFNIVDLAEDLPSELGVDLILSGHNHVVLDSPLKHNGIFIFQAGAMNSYYGVAVLRVAQGKVVAVDNRMVENISSPLDHAVMRLKEISDERKGKTVAVLKRPLLGACLRGRENNLGDFVTDAFRWVTHTDVAMTNSSALRKGFRIFPGETRRLREGDFKNMTPFQDHLVTGEVSGAQILEILEGEAMHFVNQVSGITYTIDTEQPEGQRVLNVTINGRPVQPDQTYTLTHNEFCTYPKNMHKYLHLAPGTVAWKKTQVMDYEALIQYARHLQVIDYPSEGGRIRRLP
ncbi:MAG: 5'-nucleotidase C-terminal domain-containing protein [Desulfatiglandaceae bacterium]